MDYTKREIPEGGKNWCGLLDHYIMGGEPFCSVMHREYPYLGPERFPCDKDYKQCPHYPDS